MVVETLWEISPLPGALRKPAKDPEALKAASEIRAWDRSGNMGSLLTLHYI
jgi:hypothetical protein